MVRSRKVVLIAAAFVICIVAGTALFFGAFRRGSIADASPSPELLSELPPGAPTLIFADLAAIRASSFYQQRPDHGPIAMLNGDYADFVRTTGFDFEKDLDRVVIASWPSSLGSAPGKQTPSSVIVVAEGRFDRKKIHDYALRKGKLEHQEGRDVFLFPSENQPGGTNALTFLDDHRIAIVQGSSIAPLLAAHAATTADPARDRAARVAGAAAFAITRVPPIPDNFAPGGIQSGQLLTMARSVQWVTLAARPEGNDLRVSLEGECQTPTDARQLQAALEVLRMFGRAGLDSAKTHQSMDPITLGVLETVLKTADVSASAERVRILVELTPDIFKVSAPQKTQP